MTELVYQSGLPSPASLRKRLQVKRLVVIYDQRLLKHSWMKAWLSKFEHSFAVRAGEELKQVSSFESLARKILPRIEGQSRQEVALVALGGGSVGDFVGFLASVLKRGLVFGNLPSTWLAAMDSAHGGKTALNIDGAKNQIGTFYPARTVWLSRRLLESSGSKNLESVKGEVIKTILIEGGAIYNRVSLQMKLRSFQLWKELPFLIGAKMRVVKRDMDESKGHRHVLNFGHTLGHIIEADKHLPHGVAVLLGLRFAVEWSCRRKLMSFADYMKVRALLDLSTVRMPKLSKARVEKLLRQDKKSLGKKIRFVFLRKPGQMQIIPVTVSEFLKECQRQGVIH